MSEPVCMVYCDGASDSNKLCHWGFVGQLVGRADFSGAGECPGRGGSEWAEMWALYQAVLKTDRLQLSAPIVIHSDYMSLVQKVNGDTCGKSRGRAADVLEDIRCIVGYSSTEWTFKWVPRGENRRAHRIVQGQARKAARWGASARGIQSGLRVS